jgi:hypothetical protein
MIIIVCRLYVRAAAPLEGLSATMFDSSLHVVHVVPLVTGETKLRLDEAALVLSSKFSGFLLFSNEV